MSFRQLAVTLLLVLPSGYALSQFYCGARPSPSQIEAMNELHAQRAAFELVANDIQLPVQFHVVRDSNGNSPISEDLLPGFLDEANAFFADGNLHFFACGATNFIDDSNYYDYSQFQEDALCGANDVINVINVYFTNSITNDDGDPIGGYAYYPGGPDRIFVANGNAFNGTTLTHEFGHYLSLYHTHHTSLGAEWVNGGNCDYAGDEICDTPADPNLSEQVNEFCEYTGSDTDVYGLFYEPDPTNIMSYSPSVCRNSLSPGQLVRAQFSAINQRAYLTCNNVPGCTTNIACNYNPDADSDDGSCVFVENPALDLSTNPWQLDFDWDCSVNVDSTIIDFNENQAWTSTYQGTEYEGQWSLCSDVMTFSFSTSPTIYTGFWNEEEFVGTMDDNNGSTGCFTLYPTSPPQISGCTDPLACNFDEGAVIDDNSCNYPAAFDFGCTNPESSNFDPSATIDDGSCDLSYMCGQGTVFDVALGRCVTNCCPGDVNGDGFIGALDLLDFLSLFGNNCD